MHSFFLHCPTKIYFGDDQEADFVSAAAKLGKSALLLLGGSSAQKFGYADRVEKSFSSAGVRIVRFSGIEPNPQAATINRAAALAKKEDVEFILALGGGSVMDAAKGIALLLHEKADDIWPYCWGEPKSSAPFGARPVVCIPTTSATASEVTPYAVISHAPVHGKSGLGSECLKPLVSWLNPNFTLTKPPVTTADCSADILSHVFEGYFTGTHPSPLADRICESVMQCVLVNLPRVLQNPHDIEARTHLMWASTLALKGEQGAGRGPSAFPMHAMEHSLSGRRTELAHGRGLATLFPAYFRWLHDHGRAHDRLAQLGRNLFGVHEPDDTRAGLRFIELFTGWLSAHRLLQPLSQLGFTPDDYGPVADYTLRTYGENGTLPASGPLARQDIIDIFLATEKNI